MFCILYLLFHLCFIKIKWNVKVTPIIFLSNTDLNFITGYLHVAVSFRCFCSNILAFTIRLQNNIIIIKKWDTWKWWTFFYGNGVDKHFSLLSIFTLEDDFTFNSHGTNTFLLFTFALSPHYTNNVTRPNFKQIYKELIVQIKNQLITRSSNQIPDLPINSDIYVWECQHKLIILCYHLIIKVTISGLVCHEFLLFKIYTTQKIQMCNFESLFWTQNKKCLKDIGIVTVSKQWFCFSSFSFIWFVIFYRQTNKTQSQSAYSKMSFS